MGVLDELPPENRHEVIKFMKFFKEKREQTLAAIDGDFDDCLSDRLSAAEVYTQSDVEAAIKHLQIVVKDGVRQDLTKMTSMNVLLLKNLLEASEAQRAHLHIDTSIIENEALISEVEKIRLDAMTAEAKPVPKMGKLRSFKDETAALVHEKNALSDSNATLQQRFNAIQLQCSLALSEKNDLFEENRRLRDQLARANNMGTAQAKTTADTTTGDRAKEEAMTEAHSAELRAARRDLAESRDRLRRTEEDLEAKVSATPQFQQMRKLMNDKSAQVLQLRERLKHYEPDIDADGRVRR